MWQRVGAYQIDEKGAVAPFSHRLAKEQNWSRELTLRAIEEYKRFKFLAVAVGHPVTPSTTVDEVWHLHLIYTHSYWEDYVRFFGESPPMAILGARNGENNLRLRIPDTIAVLQPMTTVRVRLNSKTI